MPKSKGKDEREATSRGVTGHDIEVAYYNLAVARNDGDQLKIELAENTLNHLLDNFNP